MWRLIGFLCLARAYASLREAAVSSSGEILSAGVKPRARVQRYVLEHAIGASEFTVRAQIEVESESGETRRLSVSGHNAMSAEEYGRFQSLVRSNGFYRLRLRAPETPHYVMASIPACDLHRAGLKDLLTVHFDGRDHVLALSYAAVIPYFAPACASKSFSDEETAFRTDLQDSAASIAAPIPLPKQAAPPPPGMEKVKSFQDKTPKAPEKQSFLGKYWYIILPMMLMLFTGQPPEAPPAEGGQQGQGQDGQDAGAARSAQPAASGSSRAGKGRGKRQR